jgi:hypothetical protein
VAFYHLDPSPNLYPWEVFKSIGEKAVLASADPNCPGLTLKDSFFKFCSAGV